MNTIAPFETTKLTPNDRVFINSIRHDLIQAPLMLGFGITASTWTFRRLFYPKKHRFLFSIFLGAVTSIPLFLYRLRWQYRRAIIELHDDSYLRQFLFRTATLANPNLNAQQLYSKLALQQHAEQSREGLLNLKPRSLTPSPSPDNQFIRHAQHDQDYHTYMQNRTQDYALGHRRDENIHTPTNSDEIIPSQYKRYGSAKIDTPWPSQSTPAHPQLKEHEGLYIPQNTATIQQY